MQEYKKILDQIINKDYKLLTKLFILYELEGIFETPLDDNKIDELYCEYIDNNNVSNIWEFIELVIDRENEVQQ